MRIIGKAVDNQGKQGQPEAPDVELGKQQKALDGFAPAVGLDRQGKRLGKSLDAEVLLTLESMDKKLKEDDLVFGKSMFEEVLVE